MKVDVSVKILAEYKHIFRKKDSSNFQKFNSNICILIADIIVSSAQNIINSLRSYHE